MLKTQPVTRRITATNENVQGFTVKYNYEFEEGKRPAFIQASATKEGEEVVYEAALHLEQMVLQTTIHKVKKDTDLTIFNAIAKDLFEIASGL